LASTGQDIRRCARCSFCADFVNPGEDLSLEGLLQLAAMDDEDALTSRTLWSEAALSQARARCSGRLDVEAILLALRAEARRRGLVV
jgi:hypothetical protein